MCFNSPLGFFGLSVIFEVVEKRVTKLVYKRTAETLSKRRRRTEVTSGASEPAKRRLKEAAV